MTHYILTNKTVFKIQTAQRSVTLPLCDHLRISRDSALNRWVQTGRGLEQIQDLAEQMSLLEALTPDGQELQNALDIRRFDRATRKMAD